MDKKLSETTYLCVEIMNSKRQVYCKGETWSRGTNLRLTLDVTWCLTSLIDLFSLYVLFSQYRPRDNTLENSFFQISSCSRAYVRTTRQSVKFPCDVYSENKTYKLKRCIVKDGKKKHKYRKIPKISPGLMFFKRPFWGAYFWRGLFSEGLIYGGKFAFQNRLG